MIRIFDDITGILQSLVIIIAAITGLLSYKKYKYSVIRYFTYFLIYLAFFECLMYYTYSVRYDGILSFLDTTILRQNYWLGALYWSIGAMLFYSWFFSKFIKTKLYKKLIKWLSFLFLIFTIITIVTQFDQFFSSGLVSLRLAGNLLLVISISLYFIEILQSNKLLVFYKTNIFYIACIVFLWLLITMPLGFYNQYYNLQDPEYVKLRSAIYFYVNLFMYIGFSLVLIFGKPENAIND
ncbi:hypothetical protein [Winogradskyella immobilis]|uniref:Histidine kinase N-terminal 7TM region domain-containing protein n=1 Tax=Winogradskyella immobilis TaxID=2816852 RepID=A0ABS8EKD8_9FLAO|nr:hypothetical protein [Winogradskyella immobilis]MCC1483674.1 hypothetical protein [Winogradskyella immobilis]MCG0015768.1 hypothetical protein [Winogradskyella immobilis]